jgi:hypothetical protein
MTEKAMLRLIEAENRMQAPGFQPPLKNTQSLHPSFQAPKFMSGVDFMLHTSEDIWRLSRSTP